MIITQPKMRKRYIIRVGMNDKETHTQLHLTEDIIEMVRKICSSHNCCFSTNTTGGGLIEKDGKKIFERSMCILLTDPPTGVVEAIGKDLVETLNQDEVLVETQVVETFFIKSDN